MGFNEGLPRRARCTPRAGAIDPTSLAIYDPDTTALTVYDDTGYAFYIDW